MIEMTSNDYYDFLEKVLERYEAGELSEEEAVQTVNLPETYLPNSMQEK